MSLLLHIIVTYIKENIITKLQKLYSPPRNPKAGNKLRALFVKKPLLKGLNWQIYSTSLSLTFLFHQILKKILEKLMHKILTFFFLTGIHSMQGWTITTRHGVTRKEAQKRLQDTENLFRKNMHLKDVC